MITECLVTVILYIMLACIDVVSIYKDILLLYIFLLSYSLSVANQ